MPVRIVEWQLPYTWGTGIEIDTNKVISLLLREENNLILVNDENEVYTDLQFAGGLTPQSDFAVWVTVWKVLQSDWWTQSGLVLNWKTTSGDYARWIYANDWKLYFDNGTGTWKQVYYSSEVDELFAQLRSELSTVAFTGDYEDLINKPIVVSGTSPTNPTEWMLWYDTTNDVLKTYDWTNWNEVWWGNVKSFSLSSYTDTANAQLAYNWYAAWKVPLIVMDWVPYVMQKFSNNRLYFSSLDPNIRHSSSFTEWCLGWIYFGINSGSVTGIVSQLMYVTPPVLATDRNYATPYTPQYDGSPATKKYVDDKVSDLMALGKFLSLWDCTTGQPISFPLSTPYTYSTWDYFLVETVSTANPPVNYKPTGSSYTGTASSTTESEPVEIGDIYIYDGTTWLLQLNHGKTVSFSEIAWQPSDNANLATALNAKQNTLATQTAYTSKWTASKVPQITTNTLWQVTWITEVNITYPSQVSDTAYGSSWNWVTATAPSKNAVYDKIQSLSSSIPTVNNGTLTITQNWTTAWTFTANQSGNTSVALTDTTYNAWPWIEIWTIQDYSAMQWPAPDGFHVPLNTERQSVYNVWTALGWWSSDWTNFWIALKLPYAGSRRHSSADVDYQGARGTYWSSSRYDVYYSYYLNFNAVALNGQTEYYCTNGYSVRCFKNSPVVPTSSWTKLYWTSIEAGGIFWSSAEWLISLSSDWQTWITIADKNLWATTVWSSWDALSEANCGKYYQWGNNYGFPRTWTIANQSTTQVDASNYWPWNYYSSDTFIKYNGGWDSTNNWNLRWWETWVVTLNNAITNTGVLSVNGQTGDVTVDESVISGDAWVTYTIKVSNSDPASWTASNIITLVQ